MALLLFSVASLPGANIIRYDIRTAFDADTFSRSVIDFDTVTKGCLGIPGAAGLTVNNINFNGGVSRSLSAGPCSGPLILWQGLVLVTPLVIRADAPAMAYTTVTLPAGVGAVAFDVGISSDPVASRIQVTLATSDKQEQTFTVMGKGTGIGGSRRVEPVFVGFISSRAISTIRFSIPDIVSSSLLLDNFTTGLTAPPPEISASGGVLHGASFQTALAPNTWVSIFGRQLSSTSRAWVGDGSSGSRLPTSLEDVSVTVNGKPAYVCYVSPSRVNVLLPADLEEGTATLHVSHGDLKSAAVEFQVQRAAPGLYLLEPDRRYPIATRVDGSLVGQASLYPGATTPARLGDTIVLWGAGFGPTAPQAPAGEIVTAPASLITMPVVTIGGIPADVRFAGLIANGLYKLEVVVPQGLPDGDAALSVAVDDARAQDGVFLPVQH